MKNKKFILFVLEISQFFRKRKWSVLRRASNTTNLDSTLKFLKLAQLAEHLEFYAPKSILELGTGASTVIISEYQKKFMIPVTCIDESEEFANNAREVSNISAQFLICPVKKSQISDIIHINYECNETFGYFDLCIIDGPNLLVQGFKYKNSINSGIIESLIERGNPPRIILVDGRDKTCEYICQNYSYKWIKTDLRNPRFFKFNYWNILLLQ